MKKVLFGIIALSMTAFAVNPGTDSTASVPVKVIAEIITAPTGLTITDEAGTVLDELVLDHGRIVKGNATGDSSVYKIFKVQRFDGTNTPAVIGAGTLAVSLDGTTTTLAKNGDASSESQLTSTLSLRGGQSYEESTDASATEHVSRVFSTIAKTELLNDKLETGIHHNSRERTLTVVYTPTAP
ncbi:hypothetical protein [Cetobacterium somerae]